MLSTVPALVFLLRKQLPLAYAWNHLFVAQVSLNDQLAFLYTTFESEFVHSFRLNYVTKLESISNIFPLCFWIDSFEIIIAALGIIFRLCVEELEHILFLLLDCLLLLHLSSCFSWLFDRLDHVNELWWSATDALLQPLNSFLSDAIVATEMYNPETLRSSQ